ncbi:hypothetical protein PVPAM_110060200 [Plasmodium vivax]|nr:hypothetical protein PVPAM_110060200 [Plasmodium vivax]
MSAEEKEFSVNNIKEEYKFIEESNFYKIFKKFDCTCRNCGYSGDDVSCYKEEGRTLTGDNDVNSLLRTLYSNLYKIYDTIEKNENDFFNNNQEEVKTMGCTYLKYWLYDQITSKKFDESQITKFFDGIYNHIKNHIHSFKVDYCNFSRLSLDEIKRLKKLYAFNTILYTADKNSENCNNNECNYMDYFEEALLEFINSIKNCSTNPSENVYCNEFYELLSLCNNFSAYTGIAVHAQYKETSGDSNRKYLLSVKDYKNQPLYVYINDNKWLDWGKISHIVNPQKSSTIAATSVVGSAIGLSSIFYYLYKFKPFGSTLRKGKEKNIVNIGEGAHDSLLYTQDSEKIPFKNKEYKVAYHAFNDT